MKTNPNDNWMNKDKCMPMKEIMQKFHICGKPWIETKTKEKDIRDVHPNKSTAKQPKINSTDFAHQMSFPSYMKHEFPFIEEIKLSDINEVALELFKDTVQVP